jgi:hypothetical protein
MCAGSLRLSRIRFMVIRIKSVCDCFIIRFPPSVYKCNSIRRSSVPLILLSRPAVRCGVRTQRLGNVSLENRLAHVRRHHYDDVLCL